MRDAGGEQQAPWLIAAVDDPPSAAGAILMLGSLLRITEPARAPPGDAPGAVLFDRIDDDLFVLTRETSRCGHRRVLGIATAADALGASDPWRLLHEGMADIVVLDGLEPIQERFRRWQAVDELVASPLVADHLIGSSPAWRSVLRDIVEIAYFSDVDVLVTGESGTGKELTAQLNRRRLSPDVVVMSDTRMRGPGRPAIIDGTRGAVSFEVELSRSGDALHAGQFGGAVANPLEALCAMVARLHDERGAIAVPGLYDRVRPLNRRERARLAREAPSDTDLLRAGGSDDPDGEAGFSAYERTTVRPALIVTGLSGGYTGPGAQSAVPARAQARLNLRLVPDQDPQEVRRLVCARLRALAPAQLDLAVRAGPGSRATTIDRRDPPVRAAARALGEAFGREPVFMRSGGSIPIVDVVQRVFGVPVVLFGFALPGDGMHAPNERVNLPTLHRGTLACARFLELVGSAVAPRERAT